MSCAASSALTGPGKRGCVGDRPSTMDLKGVPVSLSCWRVRRCCRDIWTHWVRLRLRQAAMRPVECKRFSRSLHLCQDVRLELFTIIALSLNGNGTIVCHTKVAWLELRIRVAGA